jgi:hypothetical protein
MADSEYICWRLLITGWQTTLFDEIVANHLKNKCEYHSLSIGQAVSLYSEEAFLCGLKFFRS